MSVLLVLLSACGSWGTDVIMVRPTYGWVDGCQAITITGRSFGNQPEVTIDGADLPDTTRGAGLDAGFLVAGTTPAADEAGPVDIEVKGEDGKDVLKGGYTYVACPQPGLIDAVLTPAATIGDPIEFTGCGFDPLTMSAQLIDPERSRAPVGASIQLTCSTAIANFLAPSLPDGIYHLEIVDEHGGILFPPSCDSDTADSGGGCPGPFEVVYGGAE